MSSHKIHAAAQLLQQKAQSYCSRMFEQISAQPQICVGEQNMVSIIMEEHQVGMSLGLKVRSHCFSHSHLRL